MKQLAVKTPTDYENMSNVTEELSTGLTQADAVNSPPHYNQGNIECIDAMRSALSVEEYRGYCRGACLKYLWRSNHKNGLEDLKKCAWYLARLIETFES